MTDQPKNAKDMTRDEWAKSRRELILGARRKTTDASQTRTVERIKHRQDSRSQK